MNKDNDDSGAGEEWFRKVFSRLPLPCHSLNHEGCIQEVNQAWLELLGYERKAVIGQPFRQFIAPGYIRQFTGNFKELQSGKRVGAKIMGLVRNNGSEVTVEADVSADFDEDGTLENTYAVLRDVSNLPRDARQQGNLARRHTLILNATPGAIVGFDVNGKVTFANPATEQLTGWGPQDLQGIGLHEHLHGRNPDGTPNPASECATCLALEQRETAHGEAWFQHRDGHFFAVEFHTQPYFVDGAYMGGVISFSDITERKEAQEKLRQSEEMLRHLFQNAPVALWREDFSQVRAFCDRLMADGVTDLDLHLRNNPQDLQTCMSLVGIKDVNQATLDMHGASSLAELSGNLPAILTDEAIGVFRREIVAMAHGLAGFEAPTTVRTLTGEPRSVMFRVFRDVSGEKSDMAYVALMDLTEARRVEELNTRLVTAIEQSADSVIITDRDGNIQYCNPAFEHLSGYSRDDVLGQNPRLLKSGHHDDRFYRDLWQEITAGRVWVGHFKNRNKQGEIFEEDGSISPVFDSNGNIVNFVAVKRDVTHQLALERQLAQSQKMEAVGQLAGGLAHDFNNILHAMLGHLEFAMTAGAEPEEVRSELALIQGGVEHAAQLTRQLLAFSRRQVLELQTVDPNDLVAQLLQMVRRVIGEDIELDFRPGTIDGRIHVDAGQIEQVLLNLCLNARDAMPDGGTLKISTDLVEVDAEFVGAHPWARSGAHVRLVVSDTGCGIDPAVMPQIFEPFFTTKPTGRGTGLGLATVYGTIKQHGGMILVESDPGQGATFTIYLPVSSALDGDPAAAESTAPAPGGSETILLAEDDSAVRNVVSRILRRAGYQVLEAENGQIALDIFAEHGDRIDLALLDLVMPVVGGPEVAREIQRVRPAVRILFNTGYSEDAILGRLGPDSKAPLLMKPHDPRDLLVSVRELLDDRPRG